MTSNQQVVKVPTFRMSPEEYRKMESQLPHPQASKEDTDITTGQRLGVQLALKYIREHFMVT